MHNIVIRVVKDVVNNKGLACLNCKSIVWVLSKCESTGLGVLRRWLTWAWWFPLAAQRTPCSCWRLVAALRAAAGCPEPAAAAASALGDSAARQHGSARAARTHSALAQLPCLSVRARGRLTGRPSGAEGRQVATPTPPPQVLISVGVVVGGRGSRNN